MRYLHLLRQTTFIALFLLAAVPASAAAEPAWNPFVDLAAPTDLCEALPGRAFQVSSADPTGGNDDFSHFVRINPDGSRVIADLAGPGAVTRIWITAPPGTLDDTRLRIHVDGNTPVDMPLTQFFAGETYPFLAPIVGDRESSSGGYYCYVPIAFAERLVMEIVGFGEERFYYNINWRKMPEEIPVVPFRMSLDEESRNALYEALHQWSAPYQVRTEESHRAKGSIPSGSSTVLFEDKGSGLISTIHLFFHNVPSDQIRDLRLVASWGGDVAVDAPLALLCAWNGNKGESLFHASHHRADEWRTVTSFTLRWPMPYKYFARLELINDSERNLPHFHASIGHGPVEPDSLTSQRFHAQYRKESPTGCWENYVLLDQEGWGFYVGTVLAVSGAEGEFGYLEGDPMFFIDGETEPSLLGTGTEDYFNGGWYFENGPFVTPLHGATVVDRDAAETVMFRHHFLDAVPFRESIHATIEHGTNNTFRGNYESVAIWYEGGGGGPSYPWGNALFPDVEDTPSGDGAPESGPLPPPGTNLLRNPGAEEFLTGWITGGSPNNMPTLDPWTHNPTPRNHGGQHRFGISIGYREVDCYQYQTVRVRPGKPHRASFWSTHGDGTDEGVALTWIDGEWPGTQQPLVETRDEAEPDWTFYESAPFIPSGTSVTMVVNYRHPVPTGIASIHLDDLALVEVERD